jgi:hypothetical protein
MTVLIIGFAGRRLGAAFFQERRMLRGVEEAGLGITVFFLPARNGGPGRFVELSVDLGAKSELGQPPLRFAARCPGQTYLVLGLLSCFVGNGRSIDGGYLPGCRAQAGFGSIRTGQDSQDCRREDQGTHGLSFLTLKSAS